MQIEKRQRNGFNVERLKESLKKKDVGKEKVSILIIAVMFIYIFIYPNNSRDVYLYIYLS